MIGILIIAHGNLGEELLRTADLIVGAQDQVRAFQLPANESQEHLRDKLGALLEEIKTPEGILVFTDMLGGTPCNICLPFVNKYNIEIISGVNLYMVITALMYREKLSLNEVSKKALETGQKNIADVKKMFLSRLK
ncbi:MAG: hypothetical protein A2252_00530 [Elusimicrobia bacterium RIFOXYA2_FULL_39_19]|nr:MAG: hypothetical protein A2252_00530 [Elusimicrobia bacterium RIFOXYA2_FULL_39_19]